MAKKKVNPVTGEEILDEKPDLRKRIPDLRKRKGERTVESILADSPPGTQTPGAQNTARSFFGGPLTWGGAEPAPMLGRTKSAIDREAGPAPHVMDMPPAPPQSEQLPLPPMPDALQKRWGIFDEMGESSSYLQEQQPQPAGPVRGGGRSSSLEEQFAMEPEAKRLFAPRTEMNMPPAPTQPPAPQPDMDMPPAPPTPMAQTPTNQYGQPMRGTMIPERAPEDPQKVMEEFGRGSPEHVQALQAQMRTQQVSRSRTEDMNDPRLAHLPTAKEYEMNLTRRRYGEEAIDKRADELMGEAPLRSREEAVRLAGREALDRKRQDRGMLSFEDRDAQRADIRMKQQEMFEQRRDDRAARRTDRRDRRQLEIDARRAGMSVAEYQRYQKETGAIGQEERMQQAQIDAATTEAQAGRTFEGEQAGLTRTDAAEQARLAAERTATESGLARSDAATQAGEERKVRREEITQRMQQGETANLIAQGELDLKTAIHDHAVATDGRPLTPKEMTAMAQAAVQSDAEAGVISTLSQKMAEIANAQETALRVEEERQRRTDGRPMMDAPPSRAASSPAAPIEGLPADVPTDWIQPFGDIEAGVFGMEDEPKRLQRGYLSGMDKTIDSLLTMMNDNPERAQAIAGSLATQMSEAGYGDWFDPSGILGITLGVTLADQMDDARTKGYELVQAIASGAEVDPSDYRREYKNVSGQGVSRTRKTQR